MTYLIQFGNNKVAFQNLEHATEYYEKIQKIYGKNVVLIKAKKDFEKKYRFAYSVAINLKTGIPVLVSSDYIETVVEEDKILSDLSAVKNNVKVNSEISFEDALNKARKVRVKFFSEYHASSPKK